MKYLIFERTNLVISEKNTYTMYIKIISKNCHKKFMKFITKLVDESRKQKVFNVYQLNKNTLTKIAFIKEGTLYTL